MNRRWLLSLLLASPLAVAGCGLSERPYTEKRDWPLTVERGTSGPPASPAGRRGRVLMVRTVQAGAGLEARGLATLQPDGSLRTDFYETWAVAPAQGAEAALRRWLESSGKFAAVLAPGSRMEADWIVESTLTALIAEPGRGVARAALTLILLDERGTASRVLVQRSLQADVPLTSTEPQARVEAMRAALRLVLDQVEHVLTSLT